MQAKDSMCFLLEQLLQMAHENLGSMVETWIGEDLVAVLDRLHVSYDPEELTLVLEPVGGGQRFTRVVSMSAENRTTQSEQNMRKVWVDWREWAEAQGLL